MSILRARAGSSRQLQRRRAAAAALFADTNLLLRAPPRCICTPQHHRPNTPVIPSDRNMTPIHRNITAMVVVSNKTGNQTCQDSQAPSSSTAKTPTMLPYPGQAPDAQPGQQRRRPAPSDTAPPLHHRYAFVHRRHHRPVTDPRNTLVIIVNPVPNTTIPTVTDGRAPGAGWPSSSVRRPSSSYRQVVVPVRFVSRQAYQPSSDRRRCQTPTRQHQTDSAACPVVPANVLCCLSQSALRRRTSMHNTSAPLLTLICCPARLCRRLLHRNTTDRPTPPDTTSTTNHYTQGAAGSGRQMALGRIRRAPAR